VRGDTNQYYRDFVQAMRDIGYGGYMSYELCHDLPVVDGQTVDIGYAHQQAQLAAEFMRYLIASADGLEPLSASNTTSGTTFGRPA
jgi:sugar phosphate isomerase/epimerase